MTLNDQPVLDAGGAPIRLDPNAGPPRIGRDGTITQNDRQIGALGLFKIDQQAELRARRELGRRARPAGDPGARLRQGRRASGLHRALQRQSGAGDDQAHHGAARLRGGDRRRSRTPIPPCRTPSRRSAPPAESEASRARAERDAQRTDRNHDTPTCRRTRSARLEAALASLARSRAEGRRRRQRHRGHAGLSAASRGLSPFVKLGECVELASEAALAARRGRAHRCGGRHRQAVRGHAAGAGLGTHGVAARLRHAQPACLLEGPHDQRAGRSRSTAAGRSRRASARSRPSASRRRRCGASASARP